MVEKESEGKRTGSENWEERNMNKEIKRDRVREINIEWEVLCTVNK
jgi:hypothetical protein